MDWEWNIGVFCRNEAERIAGCIDSIAAAIGNRRALVTLIVNGSHDDSALAGWRAARRNGLAIEVYTIAHADKSNAINQFFYRLRVPAQVHFGVDAYAHIGPRAFTAMADRLASNPSQLAASGVAITGRTMPAATAATLTRGGTLHGQLHAFRASFLDQLVARGLRLPINLYRGDGLLGSMLNHALDPVHNDWIEARVMGEAEATYAIPRLSMFRPADVRRQFHRTVRQMRGRIETAAIKSIVYTHGYEGLPANADVMLRDYLAAHGAPPVAVWHRPFMRLAIAEISAARAPDPASLEPRPWQCAEMPHGE